MATMRPPHKKKLINLSHQCFKYMVSTIIKAMKDSRTPEEFVNETLLPRIKNPVVLSRKPLKLSGGPLADVIHFKNGGRILILAFKRTQRNAAECRTNNRLSRPYATINNIPVLPLSEDAWPKKGRKKKEKKTKAEEGLICVVEHKEGGSKSLYHTIPVEMLWGDRSPVTKTETGLRIAEVDLGEAEFNELGRYFSETRWLNAYHEAIQYLIKNEAGANKEIALKKFATNAHLGNVKTFEEAMWRLKRLFNKKKEIIQKLDKAGNEKELLAALKKTGLAPGFLRRHTNILLQVMEAARKTGAKQKISELVWP